MNPRLLALLLALAGAAHAQPASPALAPAAAAHADPAIAAIESTLESMQAAVLAGDPDAYLAHVATADPVLLKEQANWAADLKLHVPVAFDLAIDDLEVTGPWAEGELAMTWTMENVDERRVVYRVGFAEADDGTWQYAGEVWEQVPGKGVIALCADGLQEAAQTAVDVFPEVRAHVEEGFELKVPGVQQIKLYRSMRHLQASIYLSYVDPLAGWNEPGESIKILARRRTSAEGLRVLLAHEFGHVATFVLGDKASAMPWWVLEGVADLSAEGFSRDRSRTDSLVRSWAQAGTLAPWDEITDFRKTPQKWMMHVYKQGQQFVGYVSDRYGRAGRNAWLAAMARGATLDEATEQALGISFEELDADWRATLTSDN